MSGTGAPGVAQFVAQGGAVLDRDCERIVFAVRADGEQMVLTAPTEDLAAFICGLTRASWSLRCLLGVAFG